MSTNEHRISLFGRIILVIASKLKDDSNWHVISSDEVEKEADAPD